MANESGFKPVYHLAADTTGLYEPQRSNHFEVIFEDIDNLLKAGIDKETAADTDYIKGGQELLRIALVKTDIPQLTQGTLEIKRGNTSMKAIGAKASWNDLNMAFYDFIGSDTVSVIRAWERLTYDVTTEYVGWMKDYKKKCYLIEYDPSFNPVRSWDIYGAFIHGVKENQLSFESQGEGSPRQISFTLSYDRAVPVKD